MGCGESKHAVATENTTIKSKKSKNASNPQNSKPTESVTISEKLTSNVKTDTNVLKEEKSVAAAGIEKVCMCGGYVRESQNVVKEEESKVVDDLKQNGNLATNVLEIQNGGEKVESLEAAKKEVKEEKIVGTNVDTIKETKGKEMNEKEEIVGEKIAEEAKEKIEIKEETIDEEADVNTEMNQMTNDEANVEHKEEKIDQTNVENNEGGQENLTSNVEALEGVITKEISQTSDQQSSLIQESVPEESKEINNVVAVQETKPEKESVEETKPEKESVEETELEKESVEETKPDKKNEDTIDNVDSGKTEDLSTMKADDSSTNTQEKTTSTATEEQKTEAHADEDLKVV